MTSYPPTTRRRSVHPRAISLLAALPLLAASGPAYARFAQPDSVFLNSNVAEINRLAPVNAPSEVTPPRAVETIRKILRTRDNALRELAGNLPLTEFDGIETQDQYDEQVVLAIHRVARVGVDADSTLPPEADAVRFNSVMGTLPKLGDSPVGFMVLTTTEAALAAADSLGRTRDFSPQNADKLALRMIRYLTSDFAAAREDFIRKAKVDGFRQSSVIMRLRCPKDGGTYRVVEMKNKLGESGEVSTMYFLNCMTCAEPEVLHFKLEVASRLNQAAERQLLKKAPEARRPNPGLDP
jgi:hypothetical protein